MDSGSDITILQEGLSQRIYKDKLHLLKPSDIPHITTFSDIDIQVKGKIKTFYETR